MEVAHQFEKAQENPPKKRIGSIVNCYLMVERDQRILLQLRINTGYCDGMWGCVAGHVEEGESASGAMIREARVEFFSLHGLPSSFVDYRSKAFHPMRKGEFYSELGW